MKVSGVQINTGLHWLSLYGLKKQTKRKNTFSSDRYGMNIYDKTGYKRVYGYRGSEIWLMAIRVDLFRDSGRACVCLCPGWEWLNGRAAVWSLLSIISVTQREARPLTSFRSAINWGCLSVWLIFSVLSFSLDSQRERRRYISPPAAKHDELFRVQLQRNITFGWKVAIWQIWAH